MAKVRIIIAEKPQAAEKIAKALSNNKANLIKKKPIKVWEFRDNGVIVRVTSAMGHLYTTEFSKEIHSKSWSAVDPKYLLTRAPITKIIRKESRKVVKVLLSEVRRADEVIIATDYDREGENIGMQIVEFIVKKVPRRIIVRRAIFSSLTPRELRNAFKRENLTQLNRNKIDASEVRQELDLRYGVAFTRLATMHLHKRFPYYDLPLLSIGPCQTPTLGLIVDKYEKHIEALEKAAKEKRFRIKILVKVGKAKIEFRSRKIFDEISKARTIADSLKNKKLKIIDVQEKISSKKRPLPLNTTRLAALAAKYLRFSPHETLQLAESLYLQGLISYPRTETDLYEKEVLNKAFNIARKIIEENKFDVTIRGPRQGRHTDKAHPPIHPTKVIKLSFINRKLKKKEAKLYELICRHFLANFCEDAEFKRLKIIGEINDEIFEAELIEPIRMGFLKVYTYESIGKVIEKADWKTYEELEIVDTEIEEVKPRIPQPISYSELVEKMAKLGIGTDATFADHIKKNIERGYVRESKGRLIPTPYGHALAEALRKYTPDVIDPNIRASIEALFTKVENGELTREEAVKIGINRFIKLYDEFHKNIEKIINDVEKGLREMGIEKVMGKRRKRRKRR